VSFFSSKEACRTDVELELFELGLYLLFLISVSVGRIRLMVPFHAAFK